MGTFRLGRLSSVPAFLRTDLLADPTRRALVETGLLGDVGVVEIDPALSDTATTQHHFGLEPESLANCVVVGGKREGTERLAACVVLAAARAVELTDMEYGGITPIGLPSGWPVLVDRGVIEADVVLIGSGVRRSKILLPGSLLARLPGVVVIDGLAL